MSFQSCFSVTINNSNFTDNYGSYGGVILSSMGTNITIWNCSFDDNEAYNIGGVFYVFETSNSLNNGIVNVTYSQFLNNIASGPTAFGGVMAIDSLYVT